MNETNNYISPLKAGGGVSSVNGETGDVVLDIPEALSELTEDSTHRTVTDTEKATWNGKQDAISDLETIRSGAGAGATAVQPSGLVPLQNQIDALVSKSDVVDVVGTYAELQAYQTSTLLVNDVVKVLDDSTHSNGRSYYRWNGTAFTYVGTEAVGYTKAEVDTLLNGKQNALGFTPYNSTNPAGYQTAAEVSSAIASAIGNAIGGAY